MGGAVAEVAQGSLFRETNSQIQNLKQTDCNYIQRMALEADSKTVPLSVIHQGLVEHQMPTEPIEFFAIASISYWKVC